MFNLKKIYNKIVDYLHNSKAKLLTVATLLYVNCFSALNNTLPALAKGETSTYKPTGPKVDSQGEITFNSNGDFMAKAGPAMDKLKPILGIVFGAGGLILIAIGIWQILKASRDVSKADSTGFSRIGYGAVGPIIGGAVSLGASALFSWGAITGQKVFGL